MLNFLSFAWRLLFSLDEEVLIVVCFMCALAAITSLR